MYLFVEITYNFTYNQNQIGNFTPLWFLSIRLSHTNILKIKIPDLSPEKLKCFVRVQGRPQGKSSKCR